MVCAWIRDMSVERPMLIAVSVKHDILYDTRPRPPFDVLLEETFPGGVTPPMWADCTIEVGGSSLDHWVHGAVVERHGAVTWSESTEDFPRKNGHGVEPRGKVLLAWSVDHELVAIAAPLLRDA